jgi:hypothetical protein
MVLFRYADSAKDPRPWDVLASSPFEPEFVEATATTPARAFTLSKFLGSTVPGANFATGNGLGVAVVVEAVAPVEPPRGATAFLKVVEVSLEFSPRPRDETVTV